MFIIGNFVTAVAQILQVVLQLYSFVLIGSVVVNWVGANPYNPIVRFLYSATEPVLSRLRRALPLVFGGMDFSPIVLLLAIQFLQSFLVRTLFQIGGTVGGQGAF